MRFKRKRKIANAKIYEDKRDLYCRYIYMYKFTYNVNFLLLLLKLYFYLLFNIDLKNIVNKFWISKLYFKLTPVSENDWKSVNYYIYCTLQVLW